MRSFKRTFATASGFEGRAFRGAALASAVVGLVALGGVIVRLLPWFFDPAVSLREAAPFARSIVGLALEVALLLGWPVGWALATVRVVERGEARVLEMLGERPQWTSLRLWRHGVPFAVVLAFVSYGGEVNASAPGRTVTALLNAARIACVQSDEARSYAVPFANVAWLCRPGATPLLAGHGPGALSQVAFTARGARVSGDLRHIAMDDAHLAVGNAVAVKVGALRLHGLSLIPGQGSHPRAVPPIVRAALLALTAAASAHFGVYLALVGRAKGRLGAITVGSAGPLMALGALRWLERFEAPAALSWVALPLALLAMFALSLVASCVASRLQRQGPAASP